MMANPNSKETSKHLHPSDLRGMAQLATQATTGVVDIAEGVHQSVLKTLGFPGKADQGRTGGLTGFVYNSVRGITQLVGQRVDGALSKLESLLESVGQAPPGSRERLAALAALNGILGDSMASDQNPLALNMTLHHDGRALDLQTLPADRKGPKILLLIHGLCMNDLQWRSQHKGQMVDHGLELASVLGYTPLYLRYNSGLHISENGRQLSTVLEQFLTHWPVAELSIVAHSMGGLVTRSAAHYANLEGSSWIERLKTIVFLGTPHHGSPLERAGNWVDVVLGSTPYTAPFCKLGRVRSHGITDLRYGHLLDEDWQDRDRYGCRADDGATVPLPENVACYTIAAAIPQKPGVLADRLVGDGLVPVRSALGLHDDQNRTLKFPEESKWIAQGMNHMQLLSHPDVTQQLLEWLADPRTHPSSSRTAAP
jgi:pimeloyl-ACP methyl ester carboxylesterase